MHVSNLDRTRPRKRTSIEFSTGGRVRPTITPDDPRAVVRIIEEHLTGPDPASPVQA